MELIKRYVHAVASQLPSDQRDDIAAELKDSLMEQLSDQEAALGRPLNNTEIEAFVCALGHPNKMAAGYARQQYLIGPEHFPAYKMALLLMAKIVIAIQVLISVLDIATGGSIFGEIPQLFNRLVWNLITGVGAITAVFAILEYTGERFDLFKSWDPSKLPAAEPNLQISRWETLFNLLVATIALAWWNDLISFTQVLQIDQKDLSITFSQEWQTVHWPVNIILALSIATGCYELLKEQWDKASLSMELLLCVATAVTLVYILQFEHYIIIEHLTDDASRWAQNGEKWISSIVGSTLVFILAVQLYDTWFSYGKKLMTIKKSNGHLSAATDSL